MNLFFRKDGDNRCHDVFSLHLYSLVSSIPVCSEESSLVMGGSVTGRKSPQFVFFAHLYNVLKQNNIRFHLNANKNKYIGT